MTTGISRRAALGMGAGALAIAARPAWAVEAAPSPIDAIVQRFMAAFEIPGVAVALVRPGRADLARGYGVRRLGRPEPVDADTLFSIASNTKAYTAAALAMLVEAGKLGWDEPVVRYMPDFALADPAATQMMTVRDLLCHRSGLALGAGDLMQFPRSDRTAGELLKALPHLKLARGFRAGYAYDNILYVVAGILVERMSGMAWTSFVEQRIFRPLRMPDAVANLPLVRTADIAGRHARLGPPLRGFGRLEVIEPDEGPVVAAAGGIQASARDALPWLKTQLGKGQAPGLPRLWSEKQAEEMWTPQVLTGATAGPVPENPVRPVLQGYALGWFVRDYRGRRLVWHSGGLSGQITHTALLPEQGIGLALWSNVEDGAAVSYLRYALLDHLLGAPPVDWIAATRRARAKNEAEARALAASGDVKAPPGGPSLPLAAYAGRYRDPWYGDVVVSERGGRLWIDFTRTPVFNGPLEPWGADAFRTRWARGAGEDAIVTFTLAAGRATAIRMKALSPLADFSYDFHDLALTRVE
ncbi:MAG: serine hydrolase [Alphaproteobacteria bacterium]|nr:serine hydrolase [Alphaproteobacteria bacterium]